MKPTFLGLRTTIYKVPDIAEAKKWYIEILGIEPYFDEPFYVGFNVGGYELGLHPQTNKDEMGMGGVTSYWGVEDVKAVYENLLTNGAIANEEPTDVGAGIMVASVVDPWGNLFGIIYNPTFSLPA